ASRSHLQSYSTSGVPGGKRSRSGGESGETTGKGLRGRRNVRKNAGKEAKRPRGIGRNRRRKRAGTARAAACRLGGAHDRYTRRLWTVHEPSYVRLTREALSRTTRTAGMARGPAP